jgi:hypothetical protein
MYSKHSQKLFHLLAVVSVFNEDHVIVKVHKATYRNGITRWGAFRLFPLKKSRGTNLRRQAAQGATLDPEDIRHLFSFGATESKIEVLRWRCTWPKEIQDGTPHKFWDASSEINLGRTEKTHRKWCGPNWKINLLTRILSFYILVLTFFKSK